MREIEREGGAIHMLLPIFRGCVSSPVFIPLQSEFIKKKKKSIEEFIIVHPINRDTSPPPLKSDFSTLHTFGTMYVCALTPFRFQKKYLSA